MFVIAAASGRDLAERSWDGISLWASFAATGWYDDEGWCHNGRHPLNARILTMAKLYAASICTSITCSWMKREKVGSCSSAVICGDTNAALQLVVYAFQNIQEQ